MPRLGKSGIKNRNAIKVIGGITNFFMNYNLLFLYLLKIKKC